MGKEGTLGSLLVSHRRLAGFSQQQLAERSGVGVTTISDIERGLSRAPRPSTLRTLADTLVLSAEDRTRFLAAVLPAARADLGHLGDAAGAAGPGRERASQFLSLGPMLTRLRERAGLSVPDLAYQSGLNARTIRNVEKGRTTRILPESARRLADAVGLADTEQRRNFLTLATGGQVPVAGLADAQLSTPVARSGLHGRAREYADLLARLRNPGLVTITGPGGVGKTALALAAQKELDDRRRPLEFSRLPRGHDATLGLASLAGLDDGPPGAVLDQFADSLAVGGLLVLDNLEHLARPAEMIAGLRERRPDVRMLVTSRLQLGLDSERVLDLDPLGPDESRTMFETLASRAGSSAPTGADVEIIDRICARLDGLPLAIELAAAWSAMLTPRDILAQMDHPGRLLRRSGSGLDRQASIASTVDWSLGLLPPGAVTLFRQLSVYPASWPLHLIEAVHEEPDMLEKLQQLAACGLVRVDQEGPVSRFSMLQTVQDVGRTLADADGLAARTLRRHADHLVRRAARLAAALTGPDTAGATAEISGDYLHYESALRYLTAIADPRAIDLAASLWRYWQQTGKHRAGLALIRPALRACEDDHPGTLAECRHGAGVLGYLAGEIATAAADAQAALRIFQDANDPSGVGAVMSLLGMISLFRGDIGAADRWYTTGLRTATWENAPRSHATLLSNLALVREEQADLTAASALAEEAAIRYRLLEDRRGVAIQLGNLGAWSGQAGDTERARDLLNETRQIFAELQDFNGLREVYHRLTELALNVGDVDEATSTLEQAGLCARELDDPWGDSMASAFSAEVLLFQGALAGAVREAQLAAARAADLQWRPAAIRAWLIQAVSQARQKRRADAIQAARSGLLLCTAANPAAITSFSLVVATVQVGLPEAANLAAAAAVLATRPGAAPYAVIGLILKLPVVAPPSGSPDTCAGVNAAAVRDRALTLCGQQSAMDLLSGTLLSGRDLNFEAAAESSRARPWR